MNARKIIIVCLIAAALTGSFVPAKAASPNPYWRATSNLPLETVDGEWSVTDDGRSATLSFKGVNVVGQDTTFWAGWRSPWVKASELEDGELNVLADPIATGELKVMTRVQGKGRAWGPWFRLPMAWADGGGNYMWAGSASSPFQGVVRYDWKMVGDVSGNTYIEGFAEISVD